MTSTADPLPQVGGKGFRTEIEEALPRALGRGEVEIDRGRAFLPWIELGRCRAMRLVDCDLCQPAQQLGAAVGRGMSGQQFWSLIDEGRRDIAGHEVLVLQNRLEERNIGADTPNPKLGQCPPSAGDCRLEGPSAGNELDQHGVEVGADLHADVDGPAVEADACATGGPVGGDRPGVRPETIRRILCGDPALQRCAVDPNHILGETKIAQALARGNAHLGLHQIDVGDLLGDGVLDLDPWIHFDEDVLARTLSFGFDQELHSPRAGVVDRLGKTHRVVAERLSQLGRNVRSRRDFNDLLVPPLDRAIALEQMDRVALGVGEDLYLDMPRTSYGLLNKRSRVTECPLCLAHGRSQGFPKHLRVVDSTHTAAAAPGNSLDEHRKADLFRPRHQLVDVRRRRCGLQCGNAGSLGCLESPDLVASELKNAGGRTDEHDAGLGASPRQVGIFT